jgi:hypothetical protein
MGRTLLCSLVGAGAGFLAGMAGVWMMSGDSPTSDRGAIAFLVGIFLAGCGAIAGAIIGGVADLQKFFERREQAGPQPHGRREPDSEV